jgi:hypothetical protein
MSTILVLIASALVALCALPDAHASAIISRPLYLGLDQGLVGYWSFEGKTVSGTRVFDASGTGNYGTMTNGPTLVNGKLGQAMNFDGTEDSTGDYVRVADAPALRLSDGEFTISAWVYARAWKSLDSHIIGKRTSAVPSRWTLRADSTGHFLVSLENGASTRACLQTLFISLY